MSYEKNDDEKEDSSEYETPVIPTVRVYISYTKQNHDQCDIPEVVDALTRKMSPQNALIDLIDRGMVNIYACCFNNVHKVI